MYEYSAQKTSKLNWIVVVYSGDSLLFSSLLLLFFFSFHFSFVPIQFDVFKLCKLKIFIYLWLFNNISIISLTFYRCFVVWEFLFLKKKKKKKNVVCGLRERIRSASCSRLFGNNLFKCGYYLSFIFMIIIIIIK